MVTKIVSLIVKQLVKHCCF